MRHQIIWHNKFCLNKYLLIENQVQEQGHIRKVEPKTWNFWWDPRPETLLGGCLYDNWKPSFLSRLIFNSRTFTRRVRARLSRG